MTNHLREIRKSRNLTMKELGKMVDVTEAAIGNYEKGRRQMSVEVLLKLGEALDCTVADIIMGDKIPVPKTKDGSYDNLEEEVAQANDRQRELIKRILRFSDDQLDAYLTILRSTQADQ